MTLGDGHKFELHSKGGMPRELNLFSALNNLHTNLAF